MKSSHTAVGLLRHRQDGEMPWHSNLQLIFS
jgi:hypothetical protein